ncbi:MULTISPECIES: MerR family DNA-binding transcriptional regulator [Pseudonocardia]|uniref:MerR family regulatory protein n=2 Tax=Pseudonocardia TaxID=1847 RepID=A0A1Y2MJ76_PSEAH|nr:MULTISPECIES: MerR family DNA-binding transcriptional regulator [Pseudonocardia]OSY35300.1 MerR family regulatory protein [Pseudonocardia autotrophica]TDN73261.1 MerR-like DNA binding protein [Pseudonocardia autotrophica]BBG03995.1 hypothetical protein Pdca_52040 [Pseudonocardia autotrophica]GEC27752.1 hypothetical protein PSA01_47810 [Pseudonocardia saturnea]
MTERPLLTASELAKATGLSVRTIQRYRSMGKLTPETVTPGGQARYNFDKAKRELDALAREARERHGG